MTHTNNFTKKETKEMAVDFLISKGYTANALSALQELGYTDVSLNFSKENLFASVNPSLHGGWNILY